jgi:myo-inositol-1(or 4)-monophosphatase
LLNGEPIRVSKRETLERSVLSSGFPYSKATNPDNNLKEWNRFVPRTRGMRRLGSAALDLCTVAVGRLDGYWEGDLNPWDFLAGVLIVQEAGGIVTNYAGEIGQPLLGGRRIVASNGLIHQQMLDVINEKDDA